MRHGFAIVVLGLAGICATAGGAQHQEPVTIHVDTTARKGPMHPFWAWYGHDEPNYTYTANGKKLLSALRSEEHTSELQSRGHLVCRLLLEKKKHCATTARADKTYDTEV